MASEWITTLAQPSFGYVVMDAMGQPVDNVVRARETENGVDVICEAVSPEGGEFVYSLDGGKTLHTVEAFMSIPGGMIELIDEEVS